MPPLGVIQNGVIPALLFYTSNEAKETGKTACRPDSKGKASARAQGARHPSALARRADRAEMIQPLASTKIF
jgi:hypothetical protein